MQKNMQTKEEISTLWIFCEIFMSFFLATDDVLSETTMDGILYLEDEFDKV